MSEPADGAAPVAMPLPMVIDNSVVMTWLFQDERSDFGDAVLSSVENRTIWVPGIWPLELANALLVGERRRRVTREQSDAFLLLLRGLDLNVDSVDVARIWGSVLDLSRDLTLSVYDASYLELAQRLGAELASLDEPLLRAAQAVGVGRFSLPG